MIDKLIILTITFQYVNNIFNEIWDSRLSNKTEQKYGTFLNIRAHLKSLKMAKILGNSRFIYIYALGKSQ